MDAAPLDWRPLVAALANPDARHVMGLLFIGHDPGPSLGTMSPSRRRHLVGILRASGAVAQDGSGVLSLTPGVFAELLRQGAAPRATGVERFLRGGRIAHYPSGAAARAALLRHVASRVLEPGEVVTEREITDRLGALTDDPAALRRYLVDAELVERRRDGSEYALVGEASTSPM